MHNIIILIALSSCHPLRLLSSFITAPRVELRQGFFVQLVAGFPPVCTCVLMTLWKEQHDEPNKKTSSRF